MAILKSVVDVNNGNTGWTKKDVLDALETVFANLGFHGGSQVTGVPQGCSAPGTTTVNSDVNSPSIINVTNWGRCGGTPPAQIVHKDRYFYVENQGTSAYRILEEFVFTSTNSSGVNLTDNAINVTRHGLSTGDVVVWAPGETNANYNIPNLTLNTEYYIIADTANRFKLAANATDAANGVAIDLTGYATTNGRRFRRKGSATYDNFTLDVLVGDVLNFSISDTSGGKFFLCHENNSYASNSIMTTANFGSVSYRSMPDDAGAGVSSGTLIWDTAGWIQTENEPDVPSSLKHPAFPTGLGLDGTHKYIYANNNHSGMKGEIRILPSIPNRSSVYNYYWKYTVPVSGQRSALKLRIIRDTSGSGGASNNIAGVWISDVGSGWAVNETFTIPGTSIGGASPTNDLTFGVNTNETSSGAKNGIPSVRITNFGAGSSFYQKNDNGYFAILKNVNSGSKTYGTTYYAFGMDYSNSYDMVVRSGSGWYPLNASGTTSTNSYGKYNYGTWTGYQGLDWGPNSYLQTASSESYDSHYTIRYATTSTPTAYPLKIITYRAQAPQDTNFAIIQFAQTINGVVVPHGTFTIHRGTSYGSGIWDLDNVFLGSITDYSADTRSINISTGFAGSYYSYYSSNSAAAETPTSYSLAREAFYGYVRNPGGSTYRSSSKYECNIDTLNNLDSTNVVYYRNSTYDGLNGKYVSSAANYYKPIKGIPIGDKLIPCPYYMPDDFVLLQVATTPGLTQFRPGDTVTVSPSEVYEIVLAGYQTQQNGLDNINNNNTIGMLLMARTT